MRLLPQPSRRYFLILAAVFLILAVAEAAFGSIGQAILNAGIAVLMFLGGTGRLGGRWRDLP